MSKSDDVLRNPVGESFIADRDYKAGELIEIPVEYLYRFICLGDVWVHRGFYDSVVSGLLGITAIYRSEV